MTFPRGSLATAVVLTLAAVDSLMGMQLPPAFALGGPAPAWPAAVASQDAPAQAANESYSSKRFVEVIYDRSRAAGDLLTNYVPRSHAAAAMAAGSPLDQVKKLARSLVIYNTKDVTSPLAGVDLNYTVRVYQWVPERK